jgi:hypothetical protein
MRKDEMSSHLLLTFSIPYIVLVTLALLDKLGIIS